MPLLNVKKLSIDTPTGRPLYRDLSLSLDDDKVAVIGRNGVGKSTLLTTLAGQNDDYHGSLICHGSRLFIPQQLEHCDANQLFEQYMAQGAGDIGHINRQLAKIGLADFTKLCQQQYFSPGQRRKLQLVNAKLLQPQLLILDEPSQDLDRAGLDYLFELVNGWDNGLMVVSHQPELLAQFEHFFVVSESGCQYLPCSFAQLEQRIQTDEHSQRQKYWQQLNDLIAKEQHTAQTRMRRQQKKNQGRWRELGRGTSRSALNLKRSAAQNSQARLSQLREQRIGQLHSVVKAARRSVNVSLPLTEVLPTVEGVKNPTIMARQIKVIRGGKTLVDDLSLSVTQNRLGLLGGNGAGKSSVIDVLIGNSLPDCGVVEINHQHIGFIAQGGINWQLEQSLVEQLYLSVPDISHEKVSHEKVGQLLATFGFPLALASRPMASLSAGELVRAALLCLMYRKTPVHCLVLDEPNNSLDFAANSALKQALNSWTGGLVVTSHDEGLLQSLNLDELIRL